jgi:hypothetical protein
VGLRVVTPIVGVRALRRPERSLGRDPYHGSHPIVGGIICMPYRSVFGRWVLYPLLLLCGVIMSVRRGIGMVSDQIEMTTITSVLAGLAWCACSCQSKHARPLPILPRGHDEGEVMRLPCG